MRRLGSVGAARANGGEASPTQRRCLWAFDLDDVLVVTDTRIRLSNGERISTSEFRDRRCQTMDLAADAFCEFRDVPRMLRAGPCAGLLRDVPRAEHAAVVTARSAPSSLIVEFLGRELGVDLDVRNVYCVNSEEFVAAFLAESQVMSTADRKTLALRDFRSRFPECASLVYYDDDEENVRRAREAFAGESGVSVVHIS
jgi:hypothetical protein